MNLQAIVTANVYEISIHVHHRDGKYTCGFTMGIEIDGKKELRSIFNLPSIEALESMLNNPVDEDDFL